MKVEQILEQMDKHIKALSESVDEALAIPKNEVKAKYGSIKTYTECVSMERGALNTLVTFRQWIINRSALEKHREENYEQLLERSFRKD